MVRLRNRRLDAAVLMVAACLHGVLVLLAVATAPDRRSSVLARVFHDVRQTAGPGADFFAMYHAGVAAGEGRSPYDDVQAPRDAPYYYAFRYLPFTAASLGRAVALMRPYRALLAWQAAIEISLVVWCVALWRRGSPRDRRWVVLIQLASTPLVLEMYLGQFTFVAAVIACLGVLAWRSDRPGWATGTALSAAAHLKVYPLIALVAFGSVRGRMVFLVAVLASVVAPNVFLLATSEAASGFWSRNVVGEAVGLDAGNHALAYLVFAAADAVGAPWPLPAYGWFTLAWRALVLGGAALVAIEARKTSIGLRVAWLLLAHFVSYHQVWEHHYSAVIVVGGLALLQLPADWPHGRWLAVVCLAALALPTPFFLLAPEPSTWSGLATLAGPLAKGLPLAVLFITTGLGIRRAALSRGVPRPALA